MGAGGIIAEPQGQPEYSEGVILSRKK